MIRSLLPLALALTLASCERRPDDVAVVVSAIGGDAWPADPSLRPLDLPERLILDATAQGLVRFGADGQIEPGLAERWIVIDDGRSYIFRLRDAAWPDGTRLTASAVVRALRRATAPASRNTLKPFLQVIDEIVEMTPQVIEVRLRRPRPDLLKLFAQPELAVFDRRSLNGSGPFRVQPDSDGGVLLRPMPDPAIAPEDLTDPDPEEYVRLRGERASTAIVRFRERLSDLVTGGSFVDWPLLSMAGTAPANLRIDPAAGLFGLAVVEREGFLADADNRAAVAMAIARAALTGAFLPEWSGIETLLPDQLDSAAPPALPVWQALAPEERRAAARARVARWRAANGGAAVILRIALPPGPGSTLLWGQIARALYAIGIEPQRTGMKGDADLRLVDAVAPYDSGRWYLVTACQPCGEAVGTLIEAAREAPTLAERAQRIAEADRALTDDAAFIPLARPLRWSLVALRLNAWQGNPRAWHPLTRLRAEAR